MIYLDNAATTLQKPPEVLAAVLRAMRECASPGRGVHPAAMTAADTMLDAREEAAGLFHMPDCSGVVFTMNATHGLNIAIRTLVRPGGRIVISGWEHNAVIRPLVALRARLDIAEAPLFDREGTLEAFCSRIPGADAVICTMVSNVFGFRLPVEEIGACCRRYHVPLILDLSQSAGVYDVDFPATGAAFAAMPGHKGLMGPQGTGLLLCRDGGDPLLYGGTGGESERTEMPQALPDRLEAGTPNVCGIAGLREGIRFIRRVGPGTILAHERKLAQHLAEGLAGLQDLHVFFDPAGDQSGVISVIPQKGTCEDLAEALGRQHIAVRAGLHCAPAAHRSVGTISTGTVRFSLSWYSTREEVERTGDAMKNILKNRYKL